VINPVLAEMAVYPFTRLEEERRRLLAAGVDVIDFGKGDPNEPTAPMIRQALVAALPERAPYPLAQGLPELQLRLVKDEQFRTDRATGVHIVFTVGKGADEVVYNQVGVIDRKAARAHFLVLSCRSACYQANQEQIQTVARSFTVKHP